MLLITPLNAVTKKGERQKSCTLKIWPVRNVFC